MDFTLSEEQNLLIKTTESFVKSELVQHENLLEKTNNLPKELYDEIKKKSIEVGLYACNMPKEHGGGGLNAFDLTLVEKALAHSEGQMLSTDALRMVLNNKQQLWVGFEEEELFTAVLTESVFVLNVFD